MHKFSIAVLVGILFIAGVSLPANAASVFLQFSGLVTSDTGTGSPEASQFFGINAVGTTVYITELFTSPSSIFEQGSSRPNGTTSSATIVSSNNFAESEGLEGITSGFNFTPDGFNSYITGGSGLAHGVLTIGLSKIGSTYNSELDLLYVAGTDQFESRELMLNVSNVAVIATPLPPALPLFASALAALGIAAFRQRKSARGMPVAAG
jgi:hypothetical protein